MKTKNHVIMSYLRPDMLEIKEPHDSLAYLVYTESGSKNNSGGLHHRKVQNKSVKVFANISNPKRCVLQLYQKYMSLRPANAPPDVFYLLLYVKHFLIVGTNLGQLDIIL